ncbi:MAG: helix-turn-helix domain-containing protein [Lachnospiraceae bacterium]|nr:helix-turn-helix domain-containing protein [Lachnospiraceae bacterium]
MSRIYNEITEGLLEAINEAKSKKKTLPRNRVTVIPIKEYTSTEVKGIRKSVGMSQRVFADYIGVSNKTVEAWEAGTNQPSGSASRILNMMELNNNVVVEFPFVAAKEE